ncbi:MAG: phospho-N-acetylmuramoyl-pentapeptide-transferase [Phycisphaerae bacterium]|nr:phospho-N-acetylmuramoyl-pentapeptide-transferase [Phycisphaerae bacterium]
MIYWLFKNYFADAGLGIRIGCAGAMSFFIVLFLGPRMIRFLRAKKIGDKPQFNHSVLDELNRKNSDTPTMGGVIIVLAIFASVLFFGNLSNMYIQAGLLALVWLGVLGGVDDWLKLRKAPGDTNRDGLRAWEKLLFQIGLAVLLSVFVHRYGNASSIIVDGKESNPAHSFYFPISEIKVFLPFAIYAIIMVVVMTGSSNAVNITDGMDGLAAGNLLIVTIVFLVISWIVGVAKWSQIFSLPFVPFSAEMTVLCAAMCGALLGFLWYNTSPAAVYMGDTGSLPLGGLIGFIAVITRQEILLLVVGGVFVIEAASVIIQVGYFKWTKKRYGAGRRVFAVAPIHHHFHVKGLPERKIVVRFWILGIIFAVLALGMLKLR